MLNRYIFTSKNMNGSVEFGYDMNGNLRLMNIDGELNDVQFRAVYSCLPIRESEIKTNWTKWANGKIKKIPNDVSFDAFWEMYGYKKGKKSVTENIWKGMKEAERIKAIIYIESYNNHLRQHAGQSRKYPSSYLNAQEWNN